MAEGLFKERNRGEWVRMTENGRNMFSLANQYFLSSDMCQAKSKHDR